MKDENFLVAVLVCLEEISKEYLGTLSVSKGKMVPKKENLRNFMFEESEGPL